MTDPQNNPKIPDSTSQQELLFLLQSLGEGRMPSIPFLDGLRMGNANNHEGLLDLYLLLTYLIDGHGGEAARPSATQIIGALPALLLSLRAHMEGKLAEMDANLDDHLDSFMNGSRGEHLPAEHKQRLRDTLRQTWRNEQARFRRQLNGIIVANDLATEMIEEILSMQIGLEHAISTQHIDPLKAGLGDRRYPSSADHRLISNAFLQSLGISRAAFNEFLDTCSDPE